MNEKSHELGSWDTTKLNSEHDVFEVLAELRGRKWLCRGQSRCYGGLVPSLDRGKFKGLDRVRKITLERQSIDLFRFTAVNFSHPGEQEAQSSDIIALMVLRHYGVRTRLLDWSLSPYVAAYFASCNYESDNGEIWSFDHDVYAREGRKQWSEFPETTIDGSGDPDQFDYTLSSAFKVAEPSDWVVCQFYEGFPRQTAQDGAYSLTARFDRDHSDILARLLKERVYYRRYIINANIKLKLLGVLRERHGIWRGSLFPDVAGAAETAGTVFKEGV